MQPMIAAQIYADFNAHMSRAGVSYSRWYVGITSDIDARLFGSHNVSRQGWYIYHRAMSSRDARDIESAYHRAGCQGSGGGGDNYAVFVYAYIITGETVE